MCLGVPSAAQEAFAIGERVCTACRHFRTYCKCPSNVRPRTSYDEHTAMVESLTKGNQSSSFLLTTLHHCPTSVVRIHSTLELRAEDSSFRELMFSHGGLNNNHNIPFTHNNSLPSHSGDVAQINLDGPAIPFNLPSTPPHSGGGTQIESDVSYPFLDSPWATSPHSGGVAQIGIDEQFLPFSNSFDCGLLNGGFAPTNEEDCGNATNLFWTF